MIEALLYTLDSITTCQKCDKIDVNFFDDAYLCVDRDETRRDRRPATAVQDLYG